MKKIFFPAFIYTIFLFSCSKHSRDGIQPDLSKPMIKIVYPQDIPVIPPGFPLCIKVQVSDNMDLGEVWIEINDGYGYRKNYPVSGKSIEIIEKYTAPAGVAGELTAKFFALDKTGNEASLPVRFVVEN